MEELLRPYTNEELDLLFNETGYPEIARQFVKEEFEKDFNEVLTRELRHLDRTSLENAKKDFQESLDTEFDTLREHIWNLTTTYSYVAEYVKQREVGHGHEWAKLFCDNLYDVEDASEIYTYWKTYQQLRDSRKDVECICDKKGIVLKRKEGTLSDREFKLAVKNMAKGEGEIVERFMGYMISSMNERKVEELFNEALRFRNLYNEIRNEGHDESNSWEYALDLWNENADEIYINVYREAMKHNEPHSHALHLAYFCSSSQINGWHNVEKKKYQDFPEKWQKEIIATLLIKDAGNGWPNYINEIRKSIGLNEI